MDAGTTAYAESTPPAPAPAERGPAALKFVEQLASELSTGTLNLPSFPDAIIRIRQVLNDPKSTIAQVKQAVQAEPVFTAKLFRMANSVMLRRGNDPLTDLGAVINRLGFDMVKNLAVAVTTRQLLNARKYESLHEELKDLWEHSVETAAIAFVLTRDSNYVFPDDALLAGLVHDIGVFYIFSRMETNPEIFEERDIVVGIMEDWHTGIGHAILEEWGFPPAIVEAVDEHESIDRIHKGPADLIDVVMVANLLAHGDQYVRKSVDLEIVPAFERMNLKPEAARELLKNSRPELESIKLALT